MTLEDMMFKMPDGDTFLIIAEHADVEYVKKLKYLKILCNGNDYYVKQKKDFPDRPTKDVMVTLNLDTLDLEWFKAPHEAIEMYSEPVRHANAMSLIQHYYITHSGYASLYTNNARAGRAFGEYMRDLFECKCFATMDEYTPVKNI